LGDFSAAGKPSKLYKIQDHPLRIRAIIQQTLQMNIQLDIGLEIDMSCSLTVNLHAKFNLAKPWVLRQIPLPARLKTLEELIGFPKGVLHYSHTLRDRHQGPEAMPNHLCSCGYISNSLCYFHLVI